MHAAHVCTNRRVVRPPTRSNARTGTREPTSAAIGVLGSETDKATKTITTVNAHAAYAAVAEGAKRQRAFAAMSALTPYAKHSTANHHEPSAAGKRAANSGGADLTNSEFRTNGQATAFSKPATPSQPRMTARIVAPTGLRCISLFMHSNATAVARGCHGQIRAQRLYPSQRAVC